MTGALTQREREWLLTMPAWSPTADGAALTGEDVLAKIDSALAEVPEQPLLGAARRWARCHRTLAAEYSAANDDALKAAEEELLRVVDAT